MNQIVRVMQTLYCLNLQHRCIINMGLPFVLDAVKRRTLPAWIREGLEKMDREKQKKLERERMEKERESMVKDDSINNRSGEEGDGPYLPRKSKFVSTHFDFDVSCHRQDC